MSLLGKYLYRVIAFIIKITPGWNTRRVRVVVINSNNEVLLIRNWLSEQHWTLPGGGIGRGESPEYAGIREVNEETALTLHPEKIIKIGTVYSPQLKSDLIIMKAFVESTTLGPLRWRYTLEIMDRKWSSISDLPPDMSDTTKRMIALALEGEN